MMGAEMTEPAGSAVRRRDKDGRPLELLEWAQLYEDTEYRTVAETQVGDALVRTMWEGHDVEVMGAGCMWHTGIRRDETWATVWEGNWPCALDDAKVHHEQVVSDTCDVQFDKVVSPPTETPAGWSDAVRRLTEEE